MVYYFIMYSIETVIIKEQLFSFQNNFSNERVTITQLLVDLIDKKKLNQKRLIQKLESQNFDFVSIFYYVYHINYRNWQH